MDGTTQARYFVTGPYARTTAWSSAALIGSVHAKETGRATTVCGLPALSWTTRWEFPFSPGRLQGACPTCRAHVGAQLQPAG